MMRARFQRLYSNRSLRTKVLSVTAVPLVPLLLVSLVFVTGVVREREAQAAVQHTLEVKAAVATAFGLIADTETGARGYALRPHPDTLEVVLHATAALPAHLDLLQRLVADDPVQRMHVARLTEAAAARPIADLLDYSKHPTSSARADEILAQSRAAMGEVRRQLALLQEHEDRLLADRIADARTARRQAFRAMAAGVTVGVVTSIALGVIFAGGILRRLTQLREDARRLSDGLDVQPVNGPADEIAEVQAAMADASQRLRQRDRDLSEQITALDIARGELARFFDVSLDLLCIADTDGKFRKVNRAWETSLGWTADQLISRPFIEFVHPDDVLKTQAETQALGSGTNTVGFENRYRCHDGSYKWLSWKAAHDREHGVIVASARDVTVQRAADEQLRHARAEADRANRAKSEFVSRMSHDMRTPLNAVLGFAQLLASDALTPEQRESVQLISRGGRHLLHLIDEVLDIARIEAGQLSLSLEPVDFVEVVRHAVDLIRPLAATRNVRIDITQLASNLTVRADRQRLNQLLLNLLSNAVKYNRRDGVVRLSTSDGAATGHVRLSVTDTGLGISAEKLARLFTPFERLGAEASGIEGTGLGLAVSRGLASAMGGTLGVISEEGRGSTFWVELSRTNAEVKPETNGRASIADADADLRGRVLYIEDNPSNVRLMQRILQRRPGIVLETAPSGRVGIELAISLRPQVIFLDLNLPDMHGQDVLRELQLDARVQSIPVAVLSADATPAQTRALTASGAAAYLTKPLDVAKVLATLSTLLRQSSAAPLAGDA